MKKTYTILLIKYSKSLPVVLALLLLVSCNLSKPTASSYTPIEAEKRQSLRPEQNKLPSKDRVKFENYFYNANKEKILGNYDDAIKLFILALDVDPNSSASMYELGTIFQQKQNIQYALYYSRKAALLEPDNSWYQTLYIECLRQAKKWNEISAIYKKLIKQYPNRIEYYYELANAYLYLNKASEAIGVYNDGEKVFGITEDFTMQKIKIYKATNDLDKAIDEAKALIKSSPKEYSYYGILGDLYQEKKNPEKALEIYNEMIKIAPENPYAHLTLADFYRNQKQNNKSFEEITIAFKSPDLDIDTKVKMLLSYYYVTETYTELKPDAEKLCKIIVEVHPDEAKAFSIYADFLYRDKKLEEARTQYRKAIQLDKEKFTIWNQVLILDSELNDNNALQKESGEAIELFPTQALPYFFNGIANIQLKNYQQAVTVLNQGKELVFDNPQLLSQFYSYIGDAENYLMNYTASDFAYDKALELDKKNTIVLNNYAYYLSLRNTKLEKAEAMSKRSNVLEPNNSSYQDTYGWVLYKMGKYEEAKIWVGKAMNNGGLNNGTLLDHYGDVLYKLNDVENAVIYWEKAKKTGYTSDFLERKIAEKKIYE